MKKQICLILILLLTSLPLAAQQLYMPRNVKGAYGSGLRSMDGKPTAKYFQNKSTHDIKISIAPPSRRVTGTQDIVYKNNSPIPLATLILRFDLNVHAPEAMRANYVEASQLTADMVIDEYAENGVIKPWKPLLAGKGFTYNGVTLEKPVPPGGSVTLSFKWHYDLAQKSGREGVIDPTTFFIAYFYPRIAVLDDSNWDTTAHSLLNEFYGDFNDYRLAVTVPKNYVVWSTGTLENPDEVLQPKIAERLKRSYTSDEIINVASSAEMKAGAVTAQNPTNTWRWRAENVPDVAFGLSDHYIWDASSLVVDKKTGRRASTQSAYDEPSKNFKNMVGYIKTALDYASNELPGVPYPYPKMTIFRGFADMEYPMMANDSAQEDPDMQKFIAAHEIFHTYFPFYMGINERRFGFMEEGWTTAFEYGFNVKSVGKPKADQIFKKMRVESWITSYDPGADIPIITAEDSLTGINYANNKYGKAALGYLALQDLLGEAEFKRALHEFMNRWNGKHPIPWDMFNTFNNVTGKDLNWFWNAWFFSNGYIDHRIASVAPSSSGTIVTLQNSGGFPAPMDLIVTYDDGTTETLRQTPAIWQANLKEARVSLNAKKKIKSLALDGGIFMDADPTDNKWESK